MIGTISPVFAAGGEWIPVVVLLLGGASWLINFIKEKNQEQRPVQVGRRPAQAGADPDPLQSEIDIFIQEVSRQGSQERPTQPARPQPKKPQSRRLVSQPRARKATKPAGQRRRPGGRIASREAPTSTDLGSSVREHLQDHMQTGVLSAEVAEHIDHDVNDGVAQHLGKDSTKRAAKGLQVSASVAAVRRLLHNRENVVQAILVNEILSPPKSRRR